MTHPLVMRRYADMKKAAIAYAITRIADFSDNGLNLNAHERDALQRLIDNKGDE